ncbi:MULTISPECIES: MFS transporter [unclassified Microbacterium]|uniref:MFS transporter n=1 Tax=unclassified Microbacterium TaxID=2609290 RepID=UPI000EA9BA8A|nr:MULTISPECIES: MFS transporter [unclassified Microbacterium]MBT2484004.1 MFS transporter [Microbacterium sp. ISL-108]RKN66963.1 MFS transporter [Microbacterium sp. CGR2]
MATTKKQKRTANRWIIFAIGIASQMVFSATFLGLPAASLLLQGSLDLSTGGLALVLGGASIAVVVTELPWGMAADRLGERRVLLIGVVGSMLSLVTVAAVTSMARPSVSAIATLLFVAAGAGGAVTGPSGSSILGWFAERRHGTLVSLRVAAVSAGGAAGTLAYSALLARWGPPLTFVVFAVACGICAALIWVFVFEPAVVTAQPASADTQQIRVRPALRQLSVWRVAASGLLLDVVQFLVLTFTAAILAERHGYPPAAGVAAVAAMQFVGGALRVAAGVSTDLIGWLSRTIVVRFLAVAQASCLIVVALGEDLPLLATFLALVVAGVASCAWQGAHFAQIAALAGPGHAGTALGLNNAATSLGAFIPQVLAGTLAAVLGWGSAILLLGVIPAMLAAFLFPRMTARR